MSNLNYLFAHDYYPDTGFTFANFEQCNQKLTHAIFSPSGEAIPFVDHSFVLETTYPGLVFGLGNAHQAGMNIGGTEKEGAEIKLGFTLDYVTGLPIIPGSTVKGAIRSAFRHYQEAIISSDLFSLMKGVFGSDTGAANQNCRGQCVFYDAVPVRACAVPVRAYKEKLFGLDNITPHQCLDDREYDELVNPNPLTMLKVLPGVQYLFRFGMDRLTHVDEDKKERILNLFKEILLNLGIGAKTNVGFGRLVEPEDTPAAPYKMLVYSRQATDQQNQAGAANPAGGNAPGRGGQQHNAQGRQARQQGVLAPQTRQEGICQHPGCDKETPMKKDGSGHHPFCQEHRNQKPAASSPSWKKGK